MSSAMTPHELALYYTANVGDLAWNMRPKHRRGCTRENNVVALGRVLCRNGTEQFKAVCLECGGKGGSLPFADVANIEADVVPLIAEHVANPCERCGSESGSELHHWAPRHLFDDADEWPQSYLCRDCHAEWHSTVTPKMSSSRGAA